MPSVARRCATHVLLAAALFLPAAAVAQQQVTPLSETGTAAPDAAGGLRIGPGDLLELSVFGVPELEQASRVSATGEVSLSLLGPVRLAGLTTEQAQQHIASLLADGGFLKDPHVSIFIREFAGQGVSIMGEVMKPGVYPLMGSRRLLDVIARASGLTPNAGREVVITRKSDPSQPITVTLDDDPDAPLHQNVEIFPGDTVVVSRAGLVYVVGEVAKPGGFVMENNTALTVLQAIAMAQGLGKSPDLNGARVIRRGPGGMQEIPIPLKKILQSKAPDIPLQPEDIVFVPNSFSSNLAKRALDTILQTASSAIIYRQ